MHSARKLLVVGGSGVVGRAVIDRFAGREDGDVVGVSRRPPHELPRAGFELVDLMDRSRCMDMFGQPRGFTHLVYAALSEAPGIVSGWRDRQQMQRNLDMFCNILDPLRRAGSLEHVTR